MNIKWIGSRLFHVIINIIILLFSLSCIYPLLWLFNSSLRDNIEFIRDNLKLAIPPLYENYMNAFSASGMPQAFIYSGFLSILSVICVVIFAFITGYFISRYDFRFKKVIYLLFLTGMVIPILSLLIPVFIQFKLLGILNHRLTLLLPYIAFSMPFSVILTENYIKSIPKEMDEAAYMEGCGTMRMLLSVIFPMCIPILSILVITSFMGAWNEFPFSLVLVKDVNMRTISVCIRMFNQEHTVNYTLYMAALFLTIVPILIIYSIFNKRIMDGMTIGAVKG